MAARSLSVASRPSGGVDPIGGFLCSPSRPVRLLRLAIVVGVIAFGVAMLLGLVLVLQPPLVYQKDFLNDYVVARAVAAGGDPYGPLPSLVQQYVGIASDRFPHPSPHPPTLGLLLLPLTPLSYETAAALWLGLGLASYFASVYLLCRAVGGPSRWGPLALAIAGLAWQPVRSDLGFGNVNCVLLLLLTGSWLATRRGRPTRAGILLAGSLLVKPILGPVVLLFVLRRAWRTVAACLATVVLGYGAALVAVGPGELARYVLDVTPAVQRFYQVSSLNLSVWTLGWRFFHGTVASPSLGGFTSAPLVASPAATSAISVAMPVLVLVLACLATRRLSFDWSFGLMACVSVLVSSTSWIHYLTLTALPAALTISWLVARRLPPRETTLALAVGALLCVPDFAWEQLALLAAGRPEAFSIDVRVGLPSLSFAPALLTLGPTLALGASALLVWALGIQASRRGCALAATRCLAPGGRPQPTAELALGPGARGIDRKIGSE